MQNGHIIYKVLELRVLSEMRHLPKISLFKLLHLPAFYGAQRTSNALRFHGDNSLRGHLDCFLEGTRNPMRAGKENRGTHF